MRKGRVLRSGHLPKYAIDVNIPPQPNEQAMRDECGRLVAEGLRGVTGVCGRLRITIEYVTKRGER